MQYKFFQKIIFANLLFVLLMPVSAGYPAYENVYVNDWANLLDVGSENEITKKLKKLRTDSQVEITLVTINRMSDYPNTERTIEGFALELFNHWGVGSSEKNDGVLVLVSRFDRKMRIATGRAYDSTNKNSVAKSIIDNYFIPSFKRDEYQKGILAGMSRVVQEFNPNASAALGFLGSTQNTISNTTSNAWYELKNSEFLIFMLIFSGIVVINLLKMLFGRLFSGNSNELAYFIRPNYAVDQQPTHFKQAFPNEKKVEKSRYLKGFFVGLIVITIFFFFVGFNFFKIAFLALISGVGASYAVAELSMRRRNKPKACPRCSNLMHRLSEIKDDQHLELPERVEESLQSVDYDIWLCGDCQRTKKLPYPYWKSSIHDCEQCKYRTLEIDVNTIRSASTSSEGLEEVIEDCKYCDYHHEYEQVIPRISDDDDYDSGGGSFGGGSSSGGGASGSW